MTPYIYIFVRQDSALTVAQQMVQSCHAVYQMAQRYRQNDPSLIPALILIGVPDKAALFRVINKLNDSAIGHEVFYEPDDNLGLTAIATEPLTQEQRRTLSNYRLWRNDVAPAPTYMLVPQCPQYR